ncbi:MAG: cellulose synthase subunit BcsC-related outer membrane protein [Acidithiobacillus ferrivorans]
MKKNNRKTSTVRSWVTLIVAGGFPLYAAGAYAAPVAGQTRSASDVLQSQQSQPNNVISNIYTKKNHSLATIDTAEQKIWAAINGNHLRTAQVLMQRTTTQFPGWKPQPSMGFVLLEKTIWAEIRVGQAGLARMNMQRLQTRYGQGALADKTHVSLVSMRNVLEENRLWQLLGEGHLQALQSAIQQIQSEDPGYQPPQKMLAMMHQGLAGRAVGKLERKKAWPQIVALHAQTPGVFTLAYSGNRQAWAEALAATGHPRRATLVYISLLQHSQHAVQAQSILNQAANQLPPQEMQVLYARAQAQFPNHQQTLEAQHLQYVLMMASRAHSAHQNAEAAALVAPESVAIGRLQKASDARLMGAILSANHQPHEALQWWVKAAQWSGKAADWQTVGNLAMADNDVPVAREAMAHLPAGTPASEHFRRHNDVMAALRDYKNRDYKGTLQHLQAAQRFGPLSPGMETIKAWSLVHTKDYAAASVLFTTLYQQDPSSGNAVGVLIADQQTHNLAHTYQLAATTKGPLASHLPMSTMRDHRADINTIPWRFMPPDQVVPPLARASYLALGGSWEERGGNNSGMTQMNEYLPSLQAQWGINWHMAAFAQLSSPDLYGGQPTSGQLPTFNTASTATGNATGHVWQTPQLLLGVDNREPHHHWRAALGWTSPSGIGGGTVQGLLRYTFIPSQSGSDWSVHLLRDSMRQTLLSYNGVQENIHATANGQSLNIPYTWGAAIRNQVGASGYLSGGKHNWSYIGTLHLNAITGQNIQTNYGASTYLAAMHPVYTGPGWWVTVGPSLYAETYARNASFTSPGYGGYFSPQMMAQPSLGASASHWWHGGGINMSATIGYQWLHQGGGPYLGFSPLRNQMTPQLGAQGLSLSPYAASSGSNIAGSVNAVLTQRLSTHWYLDAGASYQANPAFQQAQAGLDIRYVFGENHARTFIPAQYVAGMGRYE